jgi:hypothetical protein
MGGALDTTNRISTGTGFTGTEANNNITGFAEFALNIEDIINGRPFL